MIRCGTVFRIDAGIWKFSMSKFCLVVRIVLNNQTYHYNFIQLNWLWQARQSSPPGLWVPVPHFGESLSEAVVLFFPNTKTTIGYVK